MSSAMNLARRATAHDQRHAAFRTLNWVRTIISKPDFGPGAGTPFALSSLEPAVNLSRPFSMLGPMEMQKNVNTQNDK